MYYCAAQKISKLKTAVIDYENIAAFNIVITNATNSISFHFSQGKIEEIKTWRGVGRLSISDAGRGHQLFTGKALCPEGAK